MEHVAVFAMFLTFFFVVIGILPFWSVIRSKKGIQAALKGVNAAVVGILLAALYDPVFTSAVNGPIDFVIVLITFTLLVVYKLAPYKVVLISACIRCNCPFIIKIQKVLTIKFSVCYC